MHRIRLGFSHAMHLGRGSTRKHHMQDGRLVLIARDNLQGPNATWVEKECAGVLLQHLTMGFELDLYAPEEFCMLFW
jgi:hypothetical protein